MVLQRDQENPVWGKADPGEKVTIEFAGQKKATKADSDGKWSGGTLYDSKGGRTVKSKIRLNKDGTLKISGCVSFFCRSFDWTRVSPTMEGAAGE